MKKHWLIGGLAGVFALAGLAFVQGGGGEGAGGEGEGEGIQPIRFVHDQHAGSGEGQNNMDCMFCHYSAERSVDAGIPSVSTCWGCHQVVLGTTPEQQTEIAKIQPYVDSGEPIPWVRMYKIADHAHFPHMRHINAGLQCQDCHGEIQELDGEIVTRSGIAEVLFGTDPGVHTASGETYAPAWGGDNMGWCIDCHRQPDPETGEQQASTDCAVCHY